MEWDTALEIAATPSASWGPVALGGGALGWFAGAGFVAATFWRRLSGWHAREVRRLRVQLEDADGGSPPGATWTPWGRPVPGGSGSPVNAGYR